MAARATLVAAGAMRPHIVGRSGRRIKVAARVLALVRPSAALPLHLGVVEDGRVVGRRLVNLEHMLIQELLRDGH